MGQFQFGQSNLPQSVFIAKGPAGRKNSNRALNSQIGGRFLGRTHTSPEWMKSPTEPVRPGRKSYASSDVLMDYTPNESMP